MDNTCVRPEYAVSLNPLAAGHSRVRLEVISGAPLCPLFVQGRGGESRVLTIVFFFQKRLAFSLLNFTSLSNT